MFQIPNRKLKSDMHVQDTVLRERKPFWVCRKKKRGKRKHSIRKQFAVGNRSQQAFFLDIGPAQEKCSGRKSPTAEDRTNHMQHPTWLVLSLVYFSIPWTGKQDRTQHIDKRVSQNKHVGFSFLFIICPSREQQGADVEKTFSKSVTSGTSPCPSSLETLLNLNSLYLGFMFL